MRVEGSGVLGLGSMELLGLRGLKWERKAQHLKNPLKGTRFDFLGTLWIENPTSVFQLLAFTARMSCRSEDDGTSLQSERDWWSDNE